MGSRILIPPGTERRELWAKRALPGLVLVTHTGPDAGRIEELKPGRYWLGRPGKQQGTCPAGTGILISDPAMSRIHAALEVNATGVEIYDGGSSNGLWVDGKRVSRARLSTASLVRAGNTLFQLHIPGTGTAVSPGAAECGGTGSSLPAMDGPVEVQGTPPQRPGAGTLAAAFLPLGLGTVLAVSTGMWFFLAFSGIGALTAGAGLLVHRRRRTAFRNAEEHAAAADRRRRHALHPTLGQRCLSALTASVLGDSTPAGSIQWDPAPNSTAEGGTRNRPVALRLGTGSLPADLALRDPNNAWRPPLHDAVPVILEAEAGSTVCLMGPPEDVQGLCRSLLLQLGSGSVPDGPAVALLGTRADELICDARFLPGIALVPARHENAAVAALVTLAAQHPGLPLIVVAPPGTWNTAWRIWAALPEQTRRITCLIACRDPGNSPVRPDADATIALVRDGGVLTRDDHRQHFLPDLAGVRSFHRAALQLAASSSGIVPDGRPPLFPEPAENVWKEVRPLRAVIGHAGGQPVSLDLVADGPHLLIAGTTGSGKSELLRTLIASLACQAPPPRLNFLLIDFKGGSGLAPLADLPHTAGFLTDLSQENVARALTSLRAELRRRESLLADAQATDLDEFNARSAPKDALPRLIVVIDEFRMLADAVPNALQELMKIAAIGRSLGLHLVIATQRPQGSVTADIRANVAASICLRVQSPVDSRDIVGCDDAAAIPASSPGMAILRLAGAAPRTFQTVSTAADGQSPPLVQTLADFLSSPARTPASAGPGLERIVEGLKTAAAQAGFPERPPAPVQPPLPADLDSRPVPPPGRLRIGLADQPAQQAQDWLDWDPNEHSHLALVGLPRAGPAAAACAFARQHVAQLPGRHLYVLDGDGSLSWMAGHPQVGACVQPHETARASRVLSLLADTLLERITASRNGAGITLLVSGWGRWQESFRSARASTGEDTLLSLARDGAAADICLLVSGNRELSTARFFQLLPNRLWFPAGLSEDALLAWPRMPELGPVPGRAFVQGPLEPGTAETPVPRTADGAKTVAQCYQRDWPAGPAPLPEGTPPPRRIDGLPRSVLCSHLDPASGPGRFPVGMGGDNLKTVEAHVPPGSVFTVLGPACSGKTTLLETFAVAARLSSGHGPEAAPPRLYRIGTANGSAGADDGPPPPAGSLSGWLVLADDADQLPAEDHELMTQLASRGAGIVLSAVPAYNLLSRLPAVDRSRTPGNGVLLAPTRDSDGGFFGLRLAVEDRPIPGRGYLLTGGSHVEVQFAAPG
ncbi:FHA domain-containing protein [Arthrobacter gandavensis]|uniref:FtsK/SpoIIIE domain-containing protein n=1 Tax=Arthrobacter gandavensis TaxID=169960 RepID=UPI00189077E2|nr:FtsK/SpoIIIE domain-containing protein [Arthrobacter gandavensis]MBF4993667.1 FHA domain-containing protein [Arthrobacter gandavensis]